VRTIAIACLSLLLAAAAEPPNVSAPNVLANDSWTYASTTEDRAGWRQTHEQAIVAHANASMIATSSKQVGADAPSTEQLAGGDWSRERNVNGKQTVVNRPLNFPLSVGKSWETDYTEKNPNRAHSSERFHTTYTIAGWEDVTVPAGTFHALKIEGDGQWEATVAPSATAVAGTRVDAQGATSVTQTARTGGAVVSGRLFKAF